MGRNFDDYPGFQPFRSWANTYAQDCKMDQRATVDFNNSGCQQQFKFPNNIRKSSNQP